MTVRRRGALRQDVGKEEESPEVSGLMMNNDKSITRRDAIKLGGIMIAGVLGGAAAVNYRLLSTGHALPQVAALPSLISDKLYPGDETLPDLSGVTFDHFDGAGKQVQFLWGVATSAYQVEGNITTNDWEYFTHSNAIRAKVEAISHLGNADIRLGGPGIAADHWDLGVFGQDLKRASDLGINAYRLSLEWSRIQPNRPASTDPGVPYGEADYDSTAIAHYQEMLAMIREKGMEPIVTLNHFTLPKWVLTPPISTFDNKEFQASLRGWENEVTVDVFVKFVRLVVPNFKDDVGYWVTLNEPTGVMGLGYLVGVFPPGFVLAGDRAKNVLFNLIEAHVRAYDAIKQSAGSSARVGFAHNMIFPKADTRPNLLGNNEAATAQFDYCFNRLFLEAVTDGIENRQVSMNNQDARVRADWKGRLDFIGINYYGPAYIFQDELVSIAASWAGGRYNASLQGTTQQHSILTEKGSEIYPGGLYRFLKYLDERFHLPIFITENGISVASDPVVVGDQANQAHQAPSALRAPYIIAHLQQVLHAIKEGVNVIGYTYWTLVDTWEWSNTDGAKYGLFSIDRNSPIVAASSQPLPRTETQGAAALQYVIGEGKLGDALVKFGSISPSGVQETHA